MTEVTEAPMVAGGQAPGGHSDIEAQVSEFVAERGLSPLVPVHGKPGSKVHAARSDQPLVSLCASTRRHDGPMRPAALDDLLAPPCRGCVDRHIRHLAWQRGRSR